MTIPEAAYYILKAFASIDGEIIPEEEQQIQDFLDSHFYNGNLDQAELESLEQAGYLSGYDAVSRLQEASSCFLLESEETRQELLDFAYRLICADSKIVKEERNLFTDLADYLFMDTEKYNLVLVPG